MNERIKERRKALGIKSQSELARMLKLPRATVSAWENSVSRPKGETLIELAKALKCSPEWLSTGKGCEEAASNEQAEPSLAPVLSPTDIEQYLLGSYSAKTMAGENSGKIRDAAGGGPRTFAITQDSDGMSPRIESGDIVYVDPDQSDGKPGKSIWLFRIADSFVLGFIRSTPRGMMVDFDNQKPGWEAVPLSEALCVGQVVAYIPSWIGSH